MVIEDNRPALRVFRWYRSNFSKMLLNYWKVCFRFFVFCKLKIKIGFGFTYGGFSGNTIDAMPSKFISKFSKCDLTRCPKCWIVLGCLLKHFHIKDYKHSCMQDLKETPLIWLHTGYQVWCVCLLQHKSSQLEMFWTLQVRVVILDDGLYLYKRSAARNIVYLTNTNIIFVVILNNCSDIFNKTSLNWNYHVTVDL